MAAEKWAEDLGVQQIVGEEEFFKSTADQQAPFLTSYFQILHTSSLPLVMQLFKNIFDQFTEWAGY